MNLFQESYSVRQCTHYLNMVETNKHYIIVSTTHPEHIVRKNDKNILEVLFESADKSPESFDKTKAFFTQTVLEHRKKETAWKEQQQKVDVVHVTYDAQKANRLKKMFNK